MTAILLEFPFAFGGLQTFTCRAEWAKPFDDQKANSTCCVDSEKLMSGETPDLFFVEGHSWVYSMNRSPRSNRES